MDNNSPSDDIAQDCSINSDLSVEDSDVRLTANKF